MTMAPHLEGHEINFNASSRKSWKMYAKSMDEYLKRESVKGGGGDQMRLLDLFKIKRA